MATGAAAHAEGTVCIRYPRRMSGPSSSIARPFLGAFLGAVAGVVLSVVVMLAAKCPPVPAPASTVAPSAPVIVPAPVPVPAAPSPVADPVAPAPTVVAPVAEVRSL